MTFCRASPARTSARRRAASIGQRGFAPLPTLSRPRTRAGAFVLTGWPAGRYPSRAPPAPAPPMPRPHAPEEAPEPTDLTASDDLVYEIPSELDETVVADHRGGRPPRSGALKLAAAAAIVLVVGGALLTYRAHHRRKVVEAALSQADALLRLDTSAGYRQAASLLEPIAQLDPMNGASVRAFALAMLFADYRQADAEAQVEDLLVTPGRADTVPGYAQLASAALALARKEAGTATTAVVRGGDGPWPLALQARIALLAGSVEAALEPAAAARPRPRRLRRRSGGCSTTGTGRRRSSAAARRSTSPRSASARATTPAPAPRSTRRDSTPPRARGPTAPPHSRRSTAVRTGRCPARPPHCRARATTIRASCRPRPLPHRPHPRRPSRRRPRRRRRRRRRRGASRRRRARPERRRRRSLPQRRRRRSDRSAHRPRPRSSSRSSA